jgi:hypothetical protein
MQTQHQTMNDAVPSPLSKKAHERAVAEVSAAVTKEMLQRLKNDRANQSENERDVSTCRPRKPASV